MLSLQVCYAVKNGGGFYKGNDDDNYAYAYKDGTWASYDTVELIQQKVNNICTKSPNTLHHLWRVEMLAQPVERGKPRPPGKGDFGKGSFCLF